MDYKEKYLKYKKKYLQLKQIAGAGAAASQQEPKKEPSFLEKAGQAASDTINSAGEMLNDFLIFRGGAYSEESNGYKSEEIDGKKYPPCFKHSGPSRNMHDELKSLGLLEKYQELMDVHSVLLCVEMDVRDNGKDCIASIRPRLEKINAKPTSTPNNIVKELFASMKRDKMLEFMTKNNHPVDQHLIAIMNEVTNKANDQISRLVKESNVTKDAAENFKKMNEIFYKVHFRSIARACNPVKDQYNIDKEKSKVSSAKKEAPGKKTASKKAAKKAAPKKNSSSKKKAAPKKKASSKKK
jgi:hypothetical protein